MTESARGRMKWGLVIVSLLWVVLVGWQQVSSISDYDMPTHSSGVVKDKLSDCSGAYKQRYECKETILVTIAQQAFGNLMLRSLIVFGPPAALAIAFTYLVPAAANSPRRRRHAPAADAPTAAPDDDATGDPADDPDAWLREQRRQIKASRQHTQPPNRQAGLPF